MVKDKTLTLSIVIPVHNEERYINSCLKSIESQTVAPNEVILVNNNSTDKTLEIAKKFKFVQILHEKRQHQVYAQAKGFNTAKSQILGRLDGDSIMPRNWVEKVLSTFENDKTLVAVTDGPDPYDTLLKIVGIAIFNFYYYAYSFIAGTYMLYGANCAVKKSAWEKIRSQVHMRPDIWEDYDMAFALSKVGKVKRQRGLKMGVSFRAIHKTYFKQIKYQFRCIRTFYLNTNLFQTVIILIVWCTALTLYPIAAIDAWLLKQRQ